MHHLARVRLAALAPVFFAWSRIETGDVLYEMDNIELYERDFFRSNSVLDQLSWYIENICLIIKFLIYSTNAR